MITLYTFGPSFGLPDPSPFAIKAIALLKLAGVDFKLANGDPRKAPKAKLPWIDDNGKRIADSTFIGFHLQESYGIDFYADTTPADRATGWAFEKMCEEHLYYAIVYERWMIEENFNKGPRKFFDIVPMPMRPVVIRLVRRQVKRDLHGQGLGRHTHDEIVLLAKRDIEALSQFLGDKTYFLGDRVTGSDAVVAAFILSVQAKYFPGPLRDAVLAHHNLVAYARRMGEHWFAGEVDITPD